MSEPKRWWACECDLNEQPSKIAYEREYQLELVEAKELAALRATIEQQAQTIERVRQLELDIRDACGVDLNVLSNMGISFVEKAVKWYQQQNAQQAQELESAHELNRISAVALSEKEQELAKELEDEKCPCCGKQLQEHENLKDIPSLVQQVDQLQATLAAREAYKAVLQGAEYEQIDRIGTLSVEVAQRIGVAAAHRTKEIVAQLAASQERARELEGEIVKHRPKSECYDRVCQSLGISHDILGHVATLQATLAERERELHALATRHDAMLLRLGEVERDLYDAFHKHGQDNGMWGKWCARLLTQRNTARQDAARLMEALEAVLPIVKEVAAIEQAQAALKGRH